MLINCGALGKSLEVLGAILVLLPLYKAIAIHWRSHAAVAERSRAMLETFAKLQSSGPQPPDSVQIAEAILAMSVPMESARLGPWEIAFAIAGSLSIIAGGGLEIADRLHLTAQLCLPH